MVTLFIPLSKGPDEECQSLIRHHFFCRGKVNLYLTSNHMQLTRSLLCWCNCEATMVLKAPAGTRVLRGKTGEAVWVTDRGRNPWGELWRKRPVCLHVLLRGYSHLGTSMPVACNYKKYKQRMPSQTHMIMIFTLTPTIILFAYIYYPPFLSIYWPWFHSRAAVPCTFWLLF